jgi:hypothetical protein
LGEVTWTDRTAVGVSEFRHRAKHGLGFITNEAELAATAGLIEEMARKLDRARIAAQSLVLAVLLLAIGVYGAVNG